MKHVLVTAGAGGYIVSVAHGPLMTTQGWTRPEL